jgi:hypothetical protein
MGTKLCKNGPRGGLFLELNVWGPKRATFRATERAVSGHGNPYFHALLHKLRKPVRHYHSYGRKNVPEMYPFH